MKQFNLGWGNSRAVRSAFLEQLSGRPVVFEMKDLEEMDYAPHEGDAKLIELTKKVIQRQVGPQYDYVILTNGAAGAVTLALRAFAQMGRKVAVTREPPFFPIYPSMIRAAGLKHSCGAHINNVFHPVVLVDSPSNPGGEIMESGLDTLTPVIWDAVYHNRVYTYGNYKPLSCNVMVGSYSKLLGINGLRVGWVATNDPLLYQRLKDLATAEYCGLSNASTTILLEILGQFKDDTWWSAFEQGARYSLDCNRTEWSKVEKFFGGMRTSPNGMFYYSLVDKACRKLLERSGIQWTSGAACGHSDDFGRFNIGQDVRVIKNAVKEILKQDRI